MKMCNWYMSMSCAKEMRNMDFDHCESDTEKYEWCPMTSYGILSVYCKDEKIVVCNFSGTASEEHTV